MTANADLNSASAGPEPAGVVCPRHVGLIMDGNGRWAEARGLSRTEGHRQGLDTLRRIIRHAGHIGLEYITIFSFSSENWSRPKAEVSFLMGLLRRFVQQDLSELHETNVRIRIIGDRDGLEKGIGQLLHEAEELTRGNTGLTLVVAFNYGARNELARAMRLLAERVKAGELEPEDICVEKISSALDTGSLPDPDLIIRTSGEVRLSNFLLWQAAYSELYFCDCHWPDFDEAAFDKALEAYGMRSRRFGGLSAKAL
ncbi:isoprenyl transferase [Roseibium sp. CAU 1637]|uniref:Isoprenyl transferase n=1 Tax=Roseibium limicola TaxID=2816037 RepID=A0A939EKV7_9HYPH|nr:isoprenyl transferase [Roseibium limicola]MBO0344530.1 isoprenyl transferase [Roseibium limicola]